jgi:serine/threonine-protein kinase
MIELIGKVFGGRYRLEEKIGVGGMAEVYRAYDLTLNRTVAVKILYPQFASDADFVERFKREAQAAANLSHPNIVNVYDWGAENSTYYLVMEHLVGQNLKQIIQKKGALPPSLVVDIGRQVAAALQFAHKRNIVHRDIKPHNIIITDEGEVKVTDFGIARTLTSNLTQTGAILGTAYYISPEQAKGEEVSPLSDIYSLGVVLYEMSTGQLPFQGETPVAVALKHIQEEPPLPQKLNPAVPSSLQAVILKALARDPLLRYQSAEELRQDLAKALAPDESSFVDDEEATLVLPPETLKTATPAKSKRNLRPLFITLGVILAAVLTGLAIASLSFNRFAQVKVPDVTGLSYQQAAATLLKKGLKVKKEEEYSDKVKAGFVISQNPSAAAEVKKGATVYLTVSKGSELVKVPNLIGQSLSQANLTLDRLKLNVRNISRDYSDTIAEDLIILQRPVAGAKVKKGSFVDLVLSKGPRPIKVPDLIGKTVAEAQSILASRGLTMRRQDEFNEQMEAGRILRQDPSAGVSAVRGEAVTIIVSKGPLLIKVRDVVGLTEEEAKAQLEADGLVVIFKAGISSPTAYGKVVNQSPAAGTDVRKGATVTLWIGQNPNPDQETTN